MITREKLLIILGLAATAIIILILGLTFLLRGYGTINITIFPAEAKYKIAGEEYNGNKTLKVRSGKYKITVSSPYYQTQVITVGVRKNQNTKVDVTLDLDKDLSSKIDSLPLDQQKVIDSNQQLSYQKTVDKFVERNPITEILPYISDNYRIDYGLYNKNDPMEITLDITVFTEALDGTNEQQIKDEALLKIKEYKIDPSSINWYKDSKTNFSS